ncbi:MAG: hypothetical protein Q4D29_10890, partial [Lachnospiraceae bacterium]|nr:hypothetical protein [Lachnospiraceae bacterium]
QLLKYRRNNSVKVNIERKTEIETNDENERQHSKIQINCEISKMEQLEAVLEYSFINGIYLPFTLIKKQGLEIIHSIKNKNIKVYIKFQSVIRYNYLIKNQSLIEQVVNLSDGVLADSHEVIEFLNSINYKGCIVGDIHIYCLNNEAHSIYKDMNVYKTTMPIELSKKELLRRNIKNEEIIAYGFLPMMISAQCVNNTLKSCDKSYKEILLKDRKNANFTVINNCDTCHNVVYNNVPLSLHDEIDFIERMNPSSIRLCFTLEDSKRVNEIINIYSAILQKSEQTKVLTGKAFRQNSYTKGHLNRGVL